MKIDWLLKNGNIYNVYLKKFIPCNLAISGSRFCYMGNDPLPMEPEQIRDLGGKYVIPGFVDCHMHIESTMAAPRTFMKGAVRNGVTTLIAEPHSQCIWTCRYTGYGQNDAGRPL